VKMIWNQGFYNVDGWSIRPVRRAPTSARKFVGYCMKPEQQAIYSSTVANGRPTSMPTT